MKGVQQKLKELKRLAREYVVADQELEDVCQDKLDPIVCTVFALKRRHVDSLPIESMRAADALAAIDKSGTLLST